MYYGYVQQGRTASGAARQQEVLTAFAQEKRISFAEIIGLNEKSVKAVDAKLKTLTADDTLVLADLSCLGQRTVIILNRLSFLTQNGVALLTAQNDFSAKDIALLNQGANVFVKLIKKLHQRSVNNAMSTKEEKNIRIGRARGALNRRLTLDSRRDEVIELFKSGLSVASAARKLDVDFQTLQRFLNRNPDLDAVRPPKWNGKRRIFILEERREEVAEMLASGASLSKLSRHFDVSYQTVLRFFKENPELKEKAQ